jgi:hypothetical protein
MTMVDHQGRSDDPVLQPLPVTMCRCCIPGHVKQSRNEAAGGRAFYTCATKWQLNDDGYQVHTTKTLFFHQWINGLDKFDRRIRLFPWQQSVVHPYHEFRQCVAPSPNPPPMTLQEKQEAGCKCVSNPPLCHCRSLTV